jgi:protein TonB
VPPAPVSRLDAPVPRVATPTPGPTVQGPPSPPPPLPGPIGSAGTSSAGEAALDLPPLRIAAEFAPRVVIQPPYPAIEQRAQREGRVRVQVTIGADGRVKAVQRLSATSDAFWRATERYALSSWRFRPATEDGRPVESRKILNLHFRIEA